MSVHALASSAVLAYMASQLPLARTQELRIALTARDMVEEGHWFRPTFRGEPRYQKPPLMYWLTGVAYLCAGTTSSPLIARATGILFSVGLIVLTYLAGREWVGRRAASAAAAMLASTYLFLRFGFRIEADMAQAFWSLLSVWSAWRALMNGRAWYWWAAGAAAGLGTLTKSPAPLWTLAAVLWFGLHRHTTREQPTWLPRTSALLFALAFPLAWYLPVLLAASSSAASQAAVNSELSAMWDRPTHPGPLWYYTYATLVATLPWSPFTVLGLWRNARRARSHARERWLLTWLAAAVILLTAAANKQIHYCSLLLVPTLLMAGTWVTSRSRRGLYRIRPAYSLALDVALILVGLAMASSVLWANWVGQIAVPVWVVGAGALTGSCGVASTLRSRSATAELPRWPFLVGVWIAILVLSGPMAQWVEPDYAISRFANAARPCITDAKEIAGVGDKLAALEFHLGRPIREFPSVREALRALPEGGWFVVSSLRQSIQLPSHLQPVCEVRLSQARIALYRRD